MSGVDGTPIECGTNIVSSTSRQIRNSQIYAPQTSALQRSEGNVLPGRGVVLGEKLWGFIVNMVYVDNEKYNKKN